MPFCWDSPAAHSPCRPVPKNYQHFLALAFAIEELNQNSELLPNITLGFHIYEEKEYASMVQDASFSLLSTSGQMLPNYKCDRQEKLLSVIGNFDSRLAKDMAFILGIFKIPQVGKIFTGEKSFMGLVCTTGLNVYFALRPEGRKGDSLEEANRMGVTLEALGRFLTQ